MDKIVPNLADSKSMDAKFWDQLYQEHITKWDLGEVSPPLKSFIDQWEDKTIHILIPGGGYSHEATYLLQQSFQSITILDIATSLIQKLRIQFAAYPQVNVIEGNFFTHAGQYDMILEQTFFCTLDPGLRPAYVDKSHQLLSPGGHLAGVLFNREFDEPGPPFGGYLEEYRQLFKDLFHFQTFEPCYNSHSARQGSELFIHLIKK